MCWLYTAEDNKSKFGGIRGADITQRHMGRDTEQKVDISQVANRVSSALPKVQQPLEKKEGLK
jgi:hypothetical protein